MSSCSMVMINDNHNSTPVKLLQILSGRLFQAFTELCMKPHVASTVYIHENTGKPKVL